MILNSDLAGSQAKPSQAYKTDQSNNDGQTDASKGINNALGTTGRACASLVTPEVCTLTASIIIELL